MSKHKRDFDDQGPARYWSKNDQTYFDDSGTAYRQPGQVEIASEIASNEIRKANKKKRKHEKQTRKKKKLRREVRKVLAMNKVESVEPPKWVRPTLWERIRNTIILIKNRLLDAIRK